MVAKDTGAAEQRAVDPRGKRTTLSYNPDNRCQHKQLANGLGVTHTYDPAGWLTRIENIKSTGDAQSIFTYTYDPLGNRTTQTALDSRVTIWSYDETYQLTREQRGILDTCR